MNEDIYNKNDFNNPVRSNLSFKDINVENDEYCCEDYDRNRGYINGQSYDGLEENGYLGNSVGLKCKHDSYNNAFNDLRNLEFKNKNEVDIGLQFNNQEVNKKDGHELDIKSPDVNIFIDMDVLNKNAVFIIETPKSWDTKIFNRIKSDDNSSILNTNDIQIISIENLDGLNENNYVLKDSDRLNVEIEMSLCKENLNKSEICANLNSKPIYVRKSIKSEAENVNLSPDFSDDYFDDVVNDEVKICVATINDESIERKTFQFENSAYNEENVKNPSERFDFRYKLSNIRWPSFRSRSKSVNYCDGSENGKSNKETYDNGSKRFDFRYKLPKLELPSICVKDDSPDSDTELTRDQINSSIHGSNDQSKTKRIYFSYKLPRFSLPSFDLKRQVSKNDLETQNKENKSKRHQFPKLEFPTFSFNIKSSSINDISTDNEVNINSKTERFDFRYQLPKFEFPEFKIPIKTSVVDNTQSLGEEHNGFNSEVDVDLKQPHPEDQIKRFDFRYQIPKVEFPMFTFQEKLPTDDSFMNVQHNSLELEKIKGKHTERFDFRYQLPKVGFTFLGSTENIQNVNEDTKADFHVDPDVNSLNDVVDVESNEDRFDFRYQFPKLELPSFTLPRRSSAPGVSDDSRNDLPDSNSNIPNQTERFDFRYQFPKIELPEFIIPRNSSIIDVDTETDTNIDFRPERFDFRYQLPKIDFPLFNNEIKAQNSDRDFQENFNTSGSDANLKTNLKFPFPIPSFNFPSFQFNEKFVTSENELHYDINSDSHLRSLTDDFDIDEENFNHQVPSDAAPFKDSPTNLTKSPSFNLSRKITNPLAQIYIDKINAKRLNLGDLTNIDHDSISSEHSPFYWSQTRENDRLQSIEEHLQSSFVAPAFANRNLMDVDEHSDIDLYPSPIKTIFLPNFSPLVSINVGPIGSSSESDVGSILTIKRRNVSVPSSYTQNNETSYTNEINSNDNEYNNSSNSFNNTNYDLY